MEVVIEDYGVYLGKKSERLVIRRRDRPEEQIPLLQVEELTICSRGVTLSTDLMEECLERGITIHLLRPGGRPYGLISSPALTGTVLTRREQLLAYYDERAVEYVRALVLAKLKNQQNTLRYFGKYRKGRRPEEYERLMTVVREIDPLISQASEIDGDDIEQLRLRFMNLEGRGGEAYWRGVQILLAGRIEFEGRERRGATDPVNSCLNYGYAILYSKVWAALLRAGLEPFAGYLHVDRPGKPSLVLDAIEEFRQPVVDRALLALLGRGWTPQMEGDLISDACRKEVSRRVAERLEAAEPFEGRKLRLRSIIQRQARHLATFLRGEHHYRPFVCTW
jgi:CRISPR-associated protein Cas1